MVDKGLEAAGTLVLAGNSRCSGVGGGYGMGTRTVGAFTMEGGGPEPLPQPQAALGPCSGGLRERGEAAALAPVSRPINY